MEHHSWKYINKKDNFGNIKKGIPEYNINEICNEICNEEIYNKFYNEYGCIIIREVYDKDIMNKYDKWCNDIYDNIKSDKNINHSIQKDKILYNNIVERMGNNNPELLYKLLGNKNLNKILDNLLGFAKIGSYTGHKILAGGKRQETHVDYPIHINSSSFWRDDGGVNKLKRMITRYQLNKILPYFSLQVLTAVCDTNKLNGSTEVIPGSHLIEDIDIKLRDKKFREDIEKSFINSELKKGDILIFNRRLCHRGGENKTDKDRNAIIGQYIWSWGIGQEKINSDKFIDSIKDMEDKDKEIFKMRFNFKYPIDVSVDN